MVKSFRHQCQNEEIGKFVLKQSYIRDQYFRADIDANLLNVINVKLYTQP